MDEGESVDHILKDYPGQAAWVRDVLAMSERVRALSCAHPAGRELARQRMLSRLSDLVSKRSGGTRVFARYALHVQSLAVVLAGLVLTVSAAAALGGGITEKLTGMVQTVARPVASSLGGELEEAIPESVSVQPADDQNGTSNDGPGSDREEGIGVGDPGSDQSTEAPPSLSPSDDEEASSLTADLHLVPTPSPNTAPQPVQPDEEPPGLPATPGIPNTGNPNSPRGNPNPGNPNAGNPSPTPHPGNPDPGNPNPNPGNPNPGNPSPTPHPGNPDPGNPNPNPGNPNPGNPSPTPHPGNPNPGNPNPGNPIPTPHPGNPDPGNPNPNPGNPNPGNPNPSPGNPDPGNPSPNPGNPNPGNPNPSPGNPDPGNSNLTPNPGNSNPGDPGPTSGNPSSGNDQSPVNAGDTGGGSQGNNGANSVRNNGKKN